MRRAQAGTCAQLASEVHAILGGSPGRSASAGRGSGGGRGGGDPPEWSALLLDGSGGHRHFAAAQPHAAASWGAAVERATRVYLL